MTSPRFHCPVPLAAGRSVDLPENAARHAARVLRLRVGDDIVLFEGNGGECKARIAAVERDRVTADVLDRQAVEREAPIRVTLVQALQSGDKMDLTIQKAVELGAARRACSWRVKLSGTWVSIGRRSVGSGRRRPV